MVTISGEGLKFAQKMLDDKNGSNNIRRGALIRIEQDDKHNWQILQLPDVEAVARTDRNQRGLDVGQLQDLPVVLFVLFDADQRAAPDPFVRGDLVIEHFLREFEALARYGHHLPAAAVGAYLLGAGLQYHRGEAGRRCRIPRPAPPR